MLIYTLQLTIKDINKRLKINERMISSIVVNKLDVYGYDTYYYTKYKKYLINKILYYRLLKRLIQNYIFSYEQGYGIDEISIAIVRKIYSIVVDETGCVNFDKQLVLGSDLKELLLNNKHLIYNYKWRMKYERS